MTACTASVGNLKLIGGQWKFKAIGYGKQGEVIPGGGPLTDRHNTTFAAPDERMIAAALAPDREPAPTEPQFHQENLMQLVWTDLLDKVDWDELSALYKAAPLGDKSAAGLKTVFTNSMFRCFVYENGKLVGVGRALADGLDCSYICDIAVLPSHQGTGLGKELVGRLVKLSHGHRKIILYAVPGKEAFYRKLGFKRMSTAMAIFENQALALERGYLNDT